MNMDGPDNIITGTISAFVNSSKERCDVPDIQVASDGRNYAIAIVNEVCPNGVVDFSDGTAKAIFASEEVLKSLSVGMRVRV